MTSEGPEHEGGGDKQFQVQLLIRAYKSYREEERKGVARSTTDLCMSEPCRGTGATGGEGCRYPQALQRQGAPLLSLRSPLYKVSLKSKAPPLHTCWYCLALRYRSLLADALPRYMLIFSTSARGAPGRCEAPAANGEGPGS